MESLFLEQSILSNAMELASSHAISLAEKAKGILAAFDAFILPQPKYPELTKEDVTLCLQYESEYQQVYNFYQETAKIIERQSSQYPNIIQEKTLPLAEKPFGYFGLGYEINSAIINLNKVLINTIFSYFDKTYGLNLDEPKKNFAEALDGGSNPREKPQELSFDMLYAAIKEHLDGRSLDEAAEQKVMESFRPAIRDGHYDSDSRKYIYNGALKVLCEKNVITYQSGRNLGIGKDFFKGDGCLEGFFLGLSKYESGKPEILECFQGLCTWNGCKISFNVPTPLTGSRSVKTMEIFKKGKLIFTFPDAETARDFLDFCREC